MKIRPLAELQEVDERALIYGRLGISLTGRRTPEDATEFHQLNIVDTDLVPAVPEGTRRRFDRLRDLHTYGVLLYDLYTVADEMQAFVLEQALGERFVAYYGGAIPFTDARGDPSPLPATSFDQVFDAVGKRDGSHFKTKHLLVGSTSVQFGGSFRALLAWARAVGLLRGQRNRFSDDILLRIRNHIAHPTGYTLTGPVDSAAAVRELAETINHLWGVPTPGGKRYPGPLHRELKVLGRSVDGATESFHPDQFSVYGKEGWSYVLLRAVPHDEGLHAFSPDFERTNLPCERIWGPGSAMDAIARLEREKLAPDVVDHLDRFFMIRAFDGVLEPPRSVPTAASLGGDEAQGTWHLVRADYPSDAFGHVRNLCRSQTECDACRPCPGCPAENVRTGPWQWVLEHAMQ